MVESKNFPVYRRLSHGSNYYRIDSPEMLTEIQVVGTSWMEHVLHARQYPERMFIRDLIELELPGMEEIPEGEFIRFREECLAQRTYRSL